MQSLFHDRLDLKLNTLQYTEATCGSLNLQTGSAEYCDFECPTLKANLPTQ